MFQLSPSLLPQLSPTAGTERVFRVRAYKALRMRRNHISICIYDIAVYSPRQTKRGNWVWKLVDALRKFESSSIDKTARAFYQSAAYAANPIPQKTVIHNQAVSDEDYLRLLEKYGAVAS